jgi:hypothetical protein
MLQGMQWIKAERGYVIKQSKLTDQLKEQII